jgi:hypothetical protein
VVLAYVFFPRPDQFDGLAHDLGHLHGLDQLLMLGAPAKATAAAPPKT